MTAYKEVAIGELFQAASGQPKYVREYLEANPGSHPVYSASLMKPFGTTNSFDYDGHYLTWVMNGYGGRTQEVSGKFSATRDRGVFVPRANVDLPDLTYLRFAMEPQLRAAAVGRRIDGRQNDYTKIYPGAAEAVVIALPVTPSGQLDLEKMAELGTKLRRTEAAQAQLSLAYQPIAEAVFGITIPEPAKNVSLADKAVFSLSIGSRVLTTEHVSAGVPVYSANAIKPFGYIKKSNLSNFEKASILWGIDGNFNINFIPSGVDFATTDHCGRLQIMNPNVDPEYVYWYIKYTSHRYAFDRVYRANIGNMSADVSVTIPLRDDEFGFCLEKQKTLLHSMRTREKSRADVLATLEDTLAVQLAAAL